MKIAIFGGSFDPIHIGHKNIVKKALKKLDIDFLFVIPTFLNPLKKRSFLSPQTRLSLLKKLFSKKEKVIVCDYEINQNRAVYSLETIKYLKDRYQASKIYLIIGADNYNSFDKWFKHEEIKDLVELVVVTRNGFDYEKEDNIKRLNVQKNISSSELRQSLKLEYIPKKIRKKVKKIWQKRQDIE
ncbi:MAG: nicotinate (nicotinamide) nucleotide adenylyltransferase [Campylobacteraceae bacterium]|nr:nicotinate (nicotinamide) nucleotide adenylyltransferase [Campylobacteraceae bacterium]